VTLKGKGTEKRKSTARAKDQEGGSWRGEIGKRGIVEKRGNEKKKKIFKGLGSSSRGETRLRSMGTVSWKQRAERRKGVKWILKSKKKGSQGGEEERRNKEGEERAYGNKR